METYRDLIKDSTEVQKFLLSQVVFEKEFQHCWILLSNEILFDCDRRGGERRNHRSKIHFDLSTESHKELEKLSNKKSDKVLVFSDPTCFKLRDARGRLYDPQFQPLLWSLKRLNKDYIYLSKDNDDLHNEDFIETLVRYKVCHVSSSSLSKKEIIDFDFFWNIAVKLRSTIEKKFKDINIPLSYTNDVLRFLPLYYNLINLTKPSHVFISNYYDPEKIALIAACRLQGVKVIELAHSFQIGHEMYSFFPECKILNQIFLPNFFWTWCQRSADFINSNYPFHTENNPKPAYPGGIVNLFYSGIINIDIDKVNHLFEKTGITKASKEGLTLILVSCHPNILSNLPNFLHDFIKQSKNLFWIFKTHPRHNFYTSEKDNFLFKQKIGDLINTCVIESREIHNAILYENIDIHLTPHSSTAHELLKFGIKTIFFNSKALYFHKRDIDNGLFFYAESLIELKNHFNDLILKKEKSTHPLSPQKERLNDITYYFLNK
jgi:hypothetical protein